MTAADPLSLYLHVPFCSLKCRYCDFNSYAGLEELVPPFVDALVEEIRLWGAAAGRGRRVDTVYFGGGTPSVLPLKEIQRIVAAIRESFGVAPDAEVSLEANPGTVDEAYLRGLAGIGVNRLSLGVQSFRDDELQALDRIHSASEARETFRAARAAGLPRISLDLIYGLPEQTMERWQATLNEAITTAPEHLSLYALTVEEGTALAYDIAQGNTREPDADTQASMYEWSMERLERAGYRQYEISNWSLPGEECRHNLVYWRDGEWLGLGPGAHSHWGRDQAWRFANVYSPKQYIERIVETVERGVDAAKDTPTLLRSMRQVGWSEAPAVGGPEVAMADAAILALRLNEGLDAAAFSRRFGREIDDLYGHALVEMAGAGLLERAEGRIRLTPRGRLLANEVFVRMLPEKVGESRNKQQATRR